jgi:hypothetical protein
VFNAEEGASWTTADGKRAGAGKLAPKGFPTTKRFRRKG